MENSQSTSLTQYKDPFSIAVKRFLTTFSSKGRTSRSEFWWALLFAMIVDMGLTAVLPTILSKAVSLVIFVMTVYLWWRRMQDIGKCGWWCLIPVYNLYLAAQPSEAKENKYGAIPNTSYIAENKSWKNATLATGGIAILLYLIGSIFCGADSDGGFKTAQQYTDEAVAEYKELTQDDEEAGRQEIINRCNQLEGFLAQHNLKFASCSATGFILQDIGDGSSIEIKENTVGQLVYTTSITEEEAVNLWCKVMPVIKLQGVATMIDVQRSCERMEKKNREEAEARKIQMAKNKSDVKKLEELHAEYKKFYEACENSNRRNALLREFPDEFGALGLDTASSDSDWQTVKKAIEIKARDCLGIYGPNEGDDGTEWRTCADSIRSYGLGNKKLFKLFDKETLQ